MPQEALPLHLEGVLVVLLLGELLPAGVEIDGLRDVGVPDRPRRGAVGLDPDVAQPGHGGARGAVHLHGQQVVAPHARAPGGVEVADHAVGQLEGRVGGIVGGAGVGAARLVDAAGDVRRAEAADGLDGAEEVVDEVAPVAEHVEDDAAALLAAVVPARALGGDRVALEDPVAELAPDGEHAPEEAPVEQRLELAEARQPELVLHHAVAHAGLPGQLVERIGLARGGGGRLLAVDVAPGADGARDRGGARQGGLGVEVDGIGGIRQRRVEVGGPLQSAGLGGQRRQLLRIAPGEQRLGHDAVARRQRDAALADDRQDRAQQVLIRSHAARDAVEDEAEGVEAGLAHGFSVHCGRAPSGRGGASTPARGRVPASSWRQWATSPAGP